MAAHALLRTISRVAGADIVSDAVAFFQAFEGMEEGFRIRAGRVRELLRQPSTAFVLVASPRADSVGEAVHFADKLAETGMSVTALVVNRVQPRFADDALLARLPAATEPGRTRPGPQTGHRTPPAVRSTSSWPTCAAIRRRRTARSRPTPTWWPRWPRRRSTKCRCSNTDVHDLSGLAAVCDLLFGRRGSSSGTAGGHKCATRRALTWRPCARSWWPVTPRR